MRRSTGCAWPPYDTRLGVDRRTVEERNGDGHRLHRWADFSWALVFFGLLGKWTANLDPGSLAMAAVPWAILTSALGWLILVPLFPFWQPIFTLPTAYGIGLLVHLSASSMYPLFAWLRRSAWQNRRRSGAGPTPGLELANCIKNLVLAAAALFAAYDRGGSSVRRVAGGQPSISCGMRRA